MKRFPAKVKGSRLDEEERRHSCRGALDPPTPPCCLGIPMESETHISRQVLVHTVPRTLSLPQHPTAGAARQSKGRNNPTPSPIFDHQFLGIIHQDVKLLVGDNDTICLLCQLHHEPARREGVTDDQ